MHDLRVHLLPSVIHSVSHIWLRTAMYAQFPIRILLPRPTLKSITWSASDDKGVTSTRNVILQDLAKLNIALPHDKSASYIFPFQREAGTIAQLQHLD